MKDTTKAIILAAAKADETITPEQIANAITALKGDASVGEKPPSRVVRPREVAKRLGVSRKTLCSYGKRGLLASVYAPDKPSRRLGYTEESVERFINGATR